MEVLNYTNVRSQLKTVLDSVINDNETVIINRGKDNAVLISLSEYNSWKETLYLLESENNRERLLKAIDRDKKGSFVKKTILKD